MRPDKGLFGMPKEVPCRDDPTRWISHRSGSAFFRIPNFKVDEFNQDPRRHSPVRELIGPVAKDWLWTRPGRKGIVHGVLHEHAGLARRQPEILERESFWRSNSHWNPSSADRLIWEVQIDADFPTGPPKDFEVPIKSWQFGLETVEPPRTSRCRPIVAGSKSR